MKRLEAFGVSGIRALFVHMDTELTAHDSRAAYATRRAGGHTPRRGWTRPAVSTVSRAPAWWSRTPREMRIPALGTLVEALDARSGYRRTAPVTGSQTSGCPLRGRRSTRLTHIAVD